VSDSLSKAREIPQGIGGYYHGIVQEMIAEIERLRTQLEMWRDGNIMSESHHDEIKCLTADRDEARREVCDMESETAGGALLEARKRGWDCFKEER